ncbi:hypothetical protein [Bacillus paramycoides]|uniref:hypothetical protein n=1 Tax=Bacillus paramycoides TaxID=2026194 RepID=UPI002E224985|nr:hypothetical protein [Bacillus paramycoides]
MEMGSICCLNELTYESIIEDFAPKIRKSLRNVHVQERDDMEQEIKMKIYEKFEVLQSVAAPTFFEFIEEK